MNDYVQGNGVWLLDTQSWVAQENGSYAPTDKSGQVVDLPHTDYAWTYGAKSCACCEPTSVFPLEFNFCPHCGQQIAGITASSPRWLPPFGRGTSSRLPPEGTCKLNYLLERLKQKNPNNVPKNVDTYDSLIRTPTSGGVRFFVSELGGYQTRLFALCKSGDLYFFNPQEEWVQCAPEKESLRNSSAPWWSWSASVAKGTNKQYLILPECQRPIALSLNAVDLKYSIWEGVGRPLAGGAEFAGHIWMPVEIDGSLAMVSFSEKEGWTLGSKLSIPAISNLSAPVVPNGRSQIYWIGKEGFLCFDGNESMPSWAEWPEQGEAFPEFGPPFQNGDGLWQIVRSGQGEQQKIEYVNLYSLESKKLVARPCMTTEKLAFNYQKKLNQPWATLDEEQHQAEKFLIPLLQLDDDYCLSLEPKDRYSEPLVDLFNETEGLFVNYKIRDFESGSDESLYDGTITQPWECQFFIFNDYLHLYIESQSDRILRWKIK